MNPRATNLALNIFLWPSWFIFNLNTHLQSTILQFFGFAINDQVPFSLCELISQVAIAKVRNQTGHENIIESLNLNYFTFVQLGNVINFQVSVLNNNRRSAITQVKVFVENILVAQAIIGCQMINKRQKESY